MTVTREDGQQNLGAITASLPPGLMGMLAQVPQCGEPAASLGTCPQSSLVGSTTIAAGAGASPLHLSGSIYLTGPTKGAPFGLSLVVPAIAGPFDLGTIVARSQIEVAPNDLHLTIVTESLPQILSGIPLRVRMVSLAVNRQDMILDPDELLSNVGCGDDRISAGSELRDLLSVSGEWLWRTAIFAQAGRHDTRAGE